MNETQGKSNRRDIILILIASFFFMSSPMLVTPLIAGFSEELGAGAATMGMIGGLTNLCSLFCRPVVGNLADRVSKYKLSFVGAILMTVACAGYVTAVNDAMVIAARIVNGMGFACCTVCMSTWMSDLLPKDKIGSGMGIYGTMNALSMAIAPSIGVMVYQKMGYRVSFVIAAFFACGTAIVVQFVRDKGMPTKCSEQTNTERKIQLMDKRVFPVALIVMLFAIPYCATQSFLVRYTETRALTVTVSLFFPLYAVVLLILRLSLKSLFDRLPYKIFMTVGAGSATLSMLLLAIMQNNAIMFLAAACMAGGYGIMCSVSQSTAILLAGPGRRGLANSTYYIGLDLGMALGPIIGGLLYGNVPISLFYPLLLVTIPLIFLVYTLGLRQMDAHNRK